VGEKGGIKCRAPDRYYGGFCVGVAPGEGMARRKKVLSKSRGTDHAHTIRL
jgi:hypothetical protein